MRPLWCRNEQKRKQISQPPAPLAAHEPSVRGMAASTARAAGSPLCCAVHAAYDPESHRTRQRGAVDNPWLMFRGFRLLLLSHGWESPPSITQHEQVRVMDDTAMFSTRIPVLLHVGSSFLAHSRRERWDTLLHSRESQQHWSSSSTICSVPQGFLAQKEPPDCD